MRITKIEINNYKSIKAPIEINFCDNLPTVLIGKNGSGKTNILEALAAISEANGNYYGLNKDLPLNYKVYIRLSKEDVALLFPEKAIDEDKCLIVACSGKKCKIDRIESEYLVPHLNSEVHEICTLANELKKALDAYNRQLEKISYSGREELPVRGFQIIDFRNSTTDFERLKFQVEFVMEQAVKVADSLLKNFASGENIFQFIPVDDYYEFKDVEKLYFRLSYLKPDLAPFETKFITVNESAIKREITKINKATKESCDKISALLKAIGERTKRLKEALTDDQQMLKNDDTYYQFIREIQRCIGRKCSFLRNESSNVIFKNTEREQGFYLNDKSFVILETYLNKVYNGADKKELLKQIHSGKDFSLSDSALNEFEKFLNSTIPDFETDMYDRISVEQSNGKIPTILLHEKSGDTVALSSTSAGRRWYFTYYFMKNTLQPGDLFIIDEPAAMLHPTAQKEVMNELLELEKNGVTVVYSTHSPYLIPNDWESVHFVIMENSGTAITQEKHYDIIKQVIGGDIFNVQELVEKYKKCSSVIAANHCYYALMQKYGSIEAASKEVPFSYDTIESWKKKRRGTTFENVISIAEAIGVSPEELL